MQTVITTELGIVGNKLCITKRHVRLVGENLSFEIEIKQFDKEPRCFDECDSCVHRNFEIFEPQGCDDVKNMRSVRITCDKGEDVYKEEECPRFYPQCSGCPGC